MKELNSLEACFVYGRGCDCYCYPVHASVKESKFYKQMPHLQLCRNFCLMNSLEFHKCVYVEYKRVPASELSDP